MLTNRGDKVYYDFSISFGFGGVVKVAGIGGSSYQIFMRFDRPGCDECSIEPYAPCGGPVFIDGMHNPLVIAHSGKYTILIDDCRCDLGIEKYEIPVVYNTAVGCNKC